MSNDVAIKKIIAALAAMPMAVDRAIVLTRHLGFSLTEAKAFLVANGLWVKSAPRITFEEIQAVLGKSTSIAE